MVETKDTSQEVDARHLGLAEAHCSAAWSSSTALKSLRRPRTRSRLSGIRCAIGVVDLLDAGPHDAGEVEEADAGGDRPGRERVPAVVDPAMLDPGRLERRRPTRGTRNFSRSRASAHAGDERARVSTRGGSRLIASTTRPVSGTWRRWRLDFRHSLNSTLRVDALDRHHAVLQVDVAALEPEQLLRPKTCPDEDGRRAGREPRRHLVLDRLDLLPRLERLVLAPVGARARVPDPRRRLRSSSSIATAYSSTCRNARNT